MAVTITHSTPADGTFSATGAAAWDATHTVSGLGTMAEQNANNVNITGGSITGVTGVLSSLTVNSTPTSGGAAGQIMFDTGSVLQESSNLVWDNTNKTLTLTGYSLTGSSALSQLDLSGTWNTTGTPTAIKLTITDTASNASSLLMDLRVGASSILSVRKNGQTVVSGTSRTTFIGGGYNGVLTGNSGVGYAIDGLIAGTGGVAFASTSADSRDVFLTRRGAANLRFGAADAAAPVAQTLSVQSVVAGTSNTAGANLTITGSQGTGTGAGGSIIFQTAPAGSSGTAQNALTTALTISNTQQLQVADGSNTAPPYSFSGRPGMGFYRSGAVTVFADSSADIWWTGASNITMRSNGVFQFSSGTVVGTSGDTILRRRAAANFALGAADAAAPVAQTLSVQSVVAGTSNTAGANLTITGSQGTGTGAGGSIIFQVAPAGTTGTAQNALSDAFHIFPSSTKTAAAVVNAATTTVALGVSVSSTPVSNCGFIIGDGNTFGLACNNNQTIVRIRNTNVDATAGGIDVWGRIGISTSSNGVADAFFTRRGAANLRFGAADAAAPVAQTLSVQSVVAGTSNTAGANLTITGSQGTGTGAGGDIIFQTADVGASGTAQNTLVTALRIYSNQTVAVGKAYTVATLPAAGTQGRRAWVTDATAPTFLGALIGGGAVVCPVFDNGTAWVAG